MTVVRDAKEPTPLAIASVSPVRTRTRSALTPSRSAAICANSVW